MASSSEKRVMVVAMDEHEHSNYALEWTLEHFFTPFAPNAPFSLVIVNAKPSPPLAVSMAGPGSEIFPAVEVQLKVIAEQIIERAMQICSSRSIHEVTVEVAEGDARNVLCEAVDRHHATILVLGSHGYGAIKRAVLGSVSDHCAHHAHCTVMIVKRPKFKN
ncbi:universal stress protein PHOS34-like [Abrus precatorius]|uniref:Universal stress protein PHOS34-like n=1 Tax=Abrus precatorius TaxID=3816 RepID=A0A8B8KJ97_ABRPR|nr:universal stress protein PHOS34-like [Abrus precatorius]